MEQIRGLHITRIHPSLALDEEERKHLSLALIISFFLTGVFLFGAPLVQESVRNQELTKVLAKDFISSKVKMIHYGELDTILKENAKGITIYFGIPDTTYYRAIQNVMNDKEQVANYQNNIYIYPLVYDTDDLVSKYKLSSYANFLYFEDGIEKNRLEIRREKDVWPHLIHELNKLPMKNVKTFN